ncbi:MAG: aquaporin family protein [Flavobacteriales bacterium]|nr:aquaporin family protein [Flavobacteriales bacterium]
MTTFKILSGEIIGTFILIIFGCGSISLAINFEILNSLYQVALFWTAGVTLGIYASKKLSGAHINPCFSIATLINKEINFIQFLTYIFAQLIGAILAAISLYLVTRHKISTYSLETASVFGEYFPNPSNPEIITSTKQAFFAELSASFLLIFIILIIINIKKLQNYSPILIGILVGVLICFYAPYTQCCMNPARDFGPRLVSYFLGWEEFAFKYNNLGWLNVYIIAPLVGASLATILHRFVVRLKS